MERMRKDGAATRRRIVAAACALFGQKSYRGTTHAELCRRAGVNSAAINYHFGSKDGLYRAAWAHAAEKVDRRYPFDGGVASDAPVEARLRGNVRSLLSRNLDRSLSCFHLIRMMELVNPTGLLDDAFAVRLRSARRYTLGVLRELLGPRATQRELELCELSLISQCRMVRMRPRGRLRRELPQYTARDVECLTEHIVRFTLAGVKAMRRQIALRGRGREGVGSGGNRR